MCAIARSIAFKSIDHIVRVLSADFGYAIGRVDILVILDAMTAMAGITKHLTAFGIPGCSVVGTRGSD
jgi:hypothetical protein